MGFIVLSKTSINEVSIYFFYFLHAQAFQPLHLEKIISIYPINTSFLVQLLHQDGTLEFLLSIYSFVINI